MQAGLLLRDHRRRAARRPAARRPAAGGPARGCRAARGCGGGGYLALAPVEARVGGEVVTLLAEARAVAW